MFLQINNMNKFQFKKFKEWFFDQTETYIKNENDKGFIPVQVPYYQVTASDSCIRECGAGRPYNFNSWKYFTEYGNKNFIINGDYIEFDTPVDENGNTYNSTDACHMFYDGGVPGYYDVIRMPDGSLGRGKYHETQKHSGNYKHIKIHYKKFSYPLREEYPHIYWF